MSQSQAPEERRFKRASLGDAYGAQSRLISSPTKSQPVICQALKHEPPRNRDGNEVSIYMGSVTSVCQGGSEDATTPSTCRIQILGKNAENTSSSFMKTSASNSSSCVKYQAGFTSHQNGPIRHIAWSGNIEVVDCGSIRQCEGFTANASRIVSRKALKLSEKLAPSMQFKLHPRSDFYTEIFQKDCPDRNDIALYFFPGVTEESRTQYKGLLRDMHRKDLMLRGCVHNSELLIFSSSTLHVDCQLYDKHLFMWGIFRQLKGYTPALKGIVP